MTLRRSVVGTVLPIYSCCSTLHAERDRSKKKDFVRVVGKAKDVKLSTKGDNPQEMLGGAEFNFGWGNCCSANSCHFAYYPDITRPQLPTAATNRSVSVPLKLMEYQWCQGISGVASSEQEPTIWRSKSRWYAIYTSLGYLNH
jgi:hypothetical protein